LSTVGLVLEGIYRDGTNSIATHVWTGGKLPLFAVKWPILGFFPYAYIVGPGI